MAHWPDRLRSWRFRNNLTQREAAKALRTPLETYLGWEQGQRHPAAPGLLAIALACLERHPPVRAG